jgi:ABC-type multidrug transport system fused ATPase/permease subunit
MTFALRRSAGLALWLSRLLFGIGWGRIILGTIASGMGTALTLGSIWMLVGLVGDLNVGRTLHLSIRGHTFIEEIDFLSAIALFLVIAIGGAGLQYLGEVLGLGVARDLISRLRWDLATACRSTDADPVLGDSHAGSVISFIQTTSRECGMAAVQLVRLPPSAITVLACIAILAIIAPAIGIVLFIAAPIQVVAAAWLNRRSNAMHLEHTRMSGDVRRALNDAFGGLETGYTTGRVDQPSEDTLPEVVRRSDDIMVGRITLVRLVTLANAILAAMVIGVIMLLQDADILGLSGDWGRLLVMLVVLRFLATGIKQIAVASNVVSRFMGSIDCARRLRSPGPSFAPPPTLPGGLVVLSDRLDRLRVIRGIAELARLVPDLDRGGVQISLDPDPRIALDRVAAMDARGLLARNQHADPRAIIAVGRTRAEIEALAPLGFLPTFVADLRHKPPLTGNWGDGSDPIPTASIDGAVGLLDEDMLDED